MSENEMRHVAGGLDSYVAQGAALTLLREYTRATTELAELDLPYWRGKRDALQFALELLGVTIL